MKENTLIQLINNVCPHCGNHSEDVVEYANKDANRAFNEAEELSLEQTILFLEILLSSDFNIFIPEYKKLLLSIKSKSFWAEDLYEYYKEAFDKIEGE